MSNIYYLKNDQSQINFKIEVGTRGNAGTVAKKWRSGGSVEFIAKSMPTDNGNIPVTSLGISSELIASNLVIDTGILLDGFSDDEMDQEFSNLFMKVTLYGGLDGEQYFNIDDKEKKEFKDQKLIVITKSIKLQTQLL